MDKLIAFMFLPCDLLLYKPKLRQLHKQLSSKLPETIMLGKKSLMEKEALFLCDIDFLSKIYPTREFCPSSCVRLN